LSSAPTTSSPTPFGHTFRPTSQRPTSSTPTTALPVRPGYTHSPTTSHPTIIFTTETPQQCEHLEIRRVSTSGTGSPNIVFVVDTFVDCDEPEYMQMIKFLKNTIQYAIPPDSTVSLVEVDSRNYTTFGEKEDFINYLKDDFFPSLSQQCSIKSKSRL
jgi:hypothetical protein